MSSAVSTRSQDTMYPPRRSSMRSSVTSSGTSSTNRIRSGVIQWTLPSVAGAG